jgi:hypothetical protein
MVTSTAIGTGGLGRFGNQCYTIASVIGIAEKSHQPFAFPHWKNYDNAVFGGEVTDFEQVFENPLPRVNGQAFQEYGYFWGYRDIFLPMGDWSINAHLQSPKYFEHSLETVRKYFRMKDEPEQNDYVAIHYRAGDYIDDANAYHPRCGIEYYREAVKHFPDKTIFKVFSDDIEAAKKMFTENMGLKKTCTLRFVDGCVSYLESFKKMKKCKSFIIANSSFSAFAATIAEHPEKKVIAPKRWFGTQAGDMNWNDGYDKNWIVI